MKDMKLEGKLKKIKNGICNVAITEVMNLREDI